VLIDFFAHHSCVHASDHIDISKRHPSALYLSGGF
jgi:hypothetical protein